MTFVAAGLGVALVPRLAQGQGAGRRGRRDAARHAAGAARLRRHAPGQRGAADGPPPCSMRWATRRRSRRRGPPGSPSWLRRGRTQACPTFAGRTSTSRAAIPASRAGARGSATSSPPTRLGVSLWELPPGEVAYPYHFHLGEEEVLIVLEGAPHLRTPEGWRQLPEGEVVAFPVGEDGAHQIDNRTDATIRFLAVSTHGQPEVTVYPDEDKIGFGERHPRGGGLRAFFRAGDAVDYHEGVLPAGALVSDVRLDHVVIAVTDWERANAFYRDVCGAELVRMDDRPSPYWRYRFGEQQLNVHGPGVEPAPGRARDHGAGQRRPVPALAGADRRTRPSTCAPTVSRSRWGRWRARAPRGAGTSVYFRDPGRFARWSSSRTRDARGRREQHHRGRGCPGAGDGSPSAGFPRSLLQHPRFPNQPRAPAKPPRPRPPLVPFPR